MAFKFIPLRDIPHEFLITMGSGIHLPAKKSVFTKIVEFFKGKKTDDLESFFDFIEERDIKVCDCGCGKQISFIHVQHFDTSISYEALAVALQLQPSKSEARKNGWNGPIPKGYTELKRKFHRFYILNRED